MLQAVNVEKELVPNYHFQYFQDVLSSSEERVKRYLDLQKALVLGNAYHGKVTLTLATTEGKPISVTTTIWAVSDSHVSLKGGINIPISTIYSVDF